MNVLSLFDGISCGRVALERAGISVNKYYASEIDKYAIQVSQNNYPDIIRLGDVTKWKEWDIDWSSIDLIIAGSPCQGFSRAGKGKGTIVIVDGDEVLIDSLELYLEIKNSGKKVNFLSQSYLFWEYIEILTSIKNRNPKINFLLENVEMSKDNIEMMSRAIGVTPVMINSALVSAQNRKRLYWCNWYLEQPKDKRISLKDIIDGVWIFQKPQGKNGGGVFAKKSPTLTSNYWEHNNHVCSIGWVKWWKENKEKQLSKKYSLICNNEEKAITMTARQYASWNGNFYQIDNDTFRKLTPIECERLQTLPDNYTAGVSNTQRYKMLGNGWTVDVIAHIFTALKQALELKEVA